HFRQDCIYLLGTIPFCPKSLGFCKEHIVCWGTVFKGGVKYFRKWMCHDCQYRLYLPQVLGQQSWAVWMDQDANQNTNDGQRSLTGLGEQSCMCHHMTCFVPRNVVRNYNGPHAGAQAPTLPQTISIGWFLFYRPLIAGNKFSCWLIGGKNNASC
ncbi:MAG: hypothetical protein JWO43_516, partial [Candidatus Adlerbacteria bacterium]|nr:hypothetical protein [Candidatus Adlerbacteria bacterium]